MLTREQIEEIQTERREKGIPTKHTLRRSKAHRPALWFAGSVNGNQKCSDFGNNECSIFGIKTTVLLASAVQ